MSTDTDLATIVGVGVEFYCDSEGEGAFTCLHLGQGEPLYFRADDSLTIGGLIYNAGYSAAAIAERLGTQTLTIRRCTREGAPLAETTLVHDHPIGWADAIVAAATDLLNG